MTTWSGAHSATGKSPRHYAFAYLAAKTPEEQRQAVKGCPVEWRDLVRTHVRITKEMRDPVKKPAYLG